jgi:hypothetical protein
MMWIAGVSPLSVLEAFVAAGAALIIFGVPAALQQHRHSAARVHRASWRRGGVAAHCV